MATVVDSFRSHIFFPNMWYHVKAFGDDFLVKTGPDASIEEVWVNPADQGQAEEFQLTNICEHPLAPGYYLDTRGAWCKDYVAMQEEYEVTSDMAKFATNLLNIAQMFGVGRARQILQLERLNGSEGGYDDMIRDEVKRAPFEEVIFDKELKKLESLEREAKANASKASTKVAR